MIDFLHSSPTFSTPTTRGEAHTNTSIAPAVGSGLPVRTQFETILQLQSTSSLKTSKIPHCTYPKGIASKTAAVLREASLHAALSLCLWCYRLQVTSHSALQRSDLPSIHPFAYHARLCYSDTAAVPTFAESTLNARIPHNPAQS